MLRVSIPKMSCSGCEATIRKTLAAVPGVAGVNVTLGDKRVEIAGSADPRAVCAALAAAGYPVSEADRRAMALGAAG